MGTVTEDMEVIPVQVKEEPDSSIDPSLSVKSGADTRKEDSSSGCSSQNVTEMVQSIKQEMSTAVESEMMGLDLASNNQDIHRCKYCGQTLKTLLSLKRHEEAHRNGTIYKCRFCDYHSTSRPFMEGHESKHTGNKPFKCDYCEHRTRYLIDLKKHQRVHFSTRKYKCHLCPFRSKWQGGIDKHLATHSDVRDFKCHICNAEFKRKSGLKTHMTIHSTSKPFKCDQCDYTCRIRSMLLMHAKSHSNIRLFSCSYPGCSQKCKTKSDLTKHQNVHAEGNDFLCTKCGKAFKSKHSLSSHIKRHLEKEIDFTCPLCNKKLSTKMGLRKHLITHFAEKKYSCPICDHRFHSQANMKTHMKVHSGDRDFACPICIYSGKDCNILFTHIGSVHGQEYTYFCEECRKPFSRVQMIKHHIQRCHKESYPPDNCEFVYNQDCCNPHKAGGFKSPISHTPEFKYSAQKQNIEENNLSLYLNATQNLQNDSNSETTFSKDSLNVNGSEEDKELADSNRFGLFPMNENAHDAGEDCVSTILNRESANEIEGGKSLVIKVKRLSADESNQCKNAEINSSHISPEAFLQNGPPKVIRLGSIGDIGICLASKDSGIKFNYEKRGKKTNKWFMRTEYMPPEDAERMKRYLCRKSLSKRSQRQTKRKRKSRMSTGLKVSDPLENSGAEKVPFKRKKRKYSRKCSTVNDNEHFNITQRSDEISCSEQMNENNLSIGNFDARVKFERITSDDHKNGTNQMKERRTGQTSSQLHDGMIDDNDSCAASLLSGQILMSDKPDGTDTVEDSRNEEKGQFLACNGIKFQGTVRESNTFETLCDSDQTSCSKSHDFSLNTIPHKKHKRPPASNSKGPQQCGEKGLQRKQTKKKAVSETPLTVDSESETKSQVVVEEARFVEDIMDSPIKVTWKTVRNVKEDDNSRHDPGKRKNHPFETLNTKVGNTSDEKPPWLLPDPILFENSSNHWLTSYCKPCFIKMTDLNSMLKKPGSYINLNECFNIRNLPGNFHQIPTEQKSNLLDSSVHTIRLDEFEEEYRKKKRIIAKVDVFNQDNGMSLQSNCQVPKTSTCQSISRNQGSVNGNQTININSKQELSGQVEVTCIKQTPKVIRRKNKNQHSTRFIENQTSKNTMQTYTNPNDSKLMHDINLEHKLGKSNSRKSIKGSKKLVDQNVESLKHVEQEPENRNSEFEFEFLCPNQRRVNRALKMMEIEDVDPIKSPRRKVKKSPRTYNRKKPCQEIKVPRKSKGNFSQRKQKSLNDTRDEVKFPSRGAGSLKKAKKASTNMPDKSEKMVVKLGFQTQVKRVNLSAKKMMELWKLAFESLADDSNITLCNSYPPAHVPETENVDSHSKESSNVTSIQQKDQMEEVSVTNSAMETNKFDDSFLDRIVLNTPAVVKLEEECHFHETQEKGDNQIRVSKITDDFSHISSQTICSVSQISEGVITISSSNKSTISISNNPSHFETSGESGKGIEDISEHLKIELTQKNADNNQHGKESDVQGCCACNKEIDSETGVVNCQCMNVNHLNNISCNKESSKGNSQNSSVSSTLALDPVGAYNGESVSNEEQISPEKYLIEDGPVMGKDADSHGENNGIVASPNLTVSHLHEVGTEKEDHSFKVELSGDNALIACDIQEPIESQPSQCLSIQDNSTPFQICVARGIHGKSDSERKRNSDAEKEYPDISQSLEPGASGHQIPVQKEKCASANSLSLFLEHNQRLLQKFFPACKSVTKAYLKTFLKKWKFLPLPKQFLINQDGLICQNKLSEFCDRFPSRGKLDLLKSPRKVRQGSANKTCKPRKGVKIKNLGDKDNKLKDKTVGDKKKQRQEKALVGKNIEMKQKTKNKNTKAKANDHRDKGIKDKVIVSKDKRIREKANGVKNNEAKAKAIDEKNRWVQEREVDNENKRTKEKATGNKDTKVKEKTIENENNRMNQSARVSEVTLSPPLEIQVSNEDALLPEQNLDVKPSHSLISSLESTSDAINHNNETTNEATGNHNGSDNLDNIEHIGGYDDIEEPLQAVFEPYETEFRDESPGMYDFKRVDNFIPDNFLGVGADSIIPTSSQTILSDDVSKLIWSDLTQPSSDPQTFLDENVSRDPQTSRSPNNITPSLVSEDPPSDYLYPLPDNFFTDVPTTNTGSVI